MAIIGPVTTLPPPPTSDDYLSTYDEEHHPVLERGQMRFGWRVGLFILWVLGIAGLSSVWQVSRQIGHNTFWLGPIGDPNPLVLQLLPFVGPAAVLVGIVFNARWTVLMGALSAALIIAMGLIDLGYYQRLGFLEIAIGVVCLAGTGSAAEGRVRRSDAHNTVDTSPHR